MDEPQAIAAPFCPLGEEHCQLLNQLLASCHSTACYIEKLKSIGLDVTDWEARNGYQQTLGSGLKRVHFPDRA